MQRRKFSIASLIQIRILICGMNSTITSFSQLTKANQLLCSLRLNKHPPSMKTLKLDSSKTVNRLCHSLMTMRWLLSKSTESRWLRSCQRNHLCLTRMCSKHLIQISTFSWRKNMLMTRLASQTKKCRTWMIYKKKTCLTKRSMSSLKRKECTSGDFTVNTEMQMSQNATAVSLLQETLNKSESWSMLMQKIPKK